MIGVAAIAGWAAAVVAGGVLGGLTPQRYDPPQETIDPATQRVVVRLVQVPVPTRDWPAETAQMSVAAGLGAILAARATAARQRRRRTPRPGPGLIDITDVVRSGATPCRSPADLPDRADEHVGRPGEDPQVVVGRGGEPMGAGADHEDRRAVRR